MLFDDLERGGWSKTEGIYVYIQLIHFIIQQKLTQHGKATISHYHPSCAQLRWLFRPPWTIELATPWTIQLKTLGTIDCQAPLSMGFPRQEYWSWLSFPTAGDLPSPGTESVSPTLAGRFFTPGPPGKPWGHNSSLFSPMFLSNTEKQGKC